MIANYSLKAEELTHDFIGKLKELHKGLAINITVIDTEQISDETTYLLNNSANRTKLLKALDNVRKGNVVEIDLATIEKNANSL